MDKELLKQKVCRAIDANREKICEIGRAIYKTPQLGYKETFASELVQKTFDELGLKYEAGLAVTGVKAKLKDDAKGPNVAIMGELDAVVCPDHPDADKSTGAAHCCGHFAQTTGMLAAAMGLATVKDELEGGNITFMAVPAEECVEIEYREGLIKEGKIKYLGGKQEMIHVGAFDDVDVAMMIHGNTMEKGILTGSPAVGFVAKTVKFIGKEAHAGGAPWDGVNALNAASLALMAINSIRETLKDEDTIRIHPIITKGGTLVNIVPNDVRMEMYVRGATIDAIKDANAKVNRAIRGAAYAVGAEVEISDLPGYLPVEDNKDIQAVFGANAKALYPDFDVFSNDKIGGGSSDVGDVETIIPCIQGGIGGFVNGFHTKDFRIVDEDMAFIMPAKVMACTAIDLLADDAKLAKEAMANFNSPYNAKNYDTIWDDIMSV